MKPLAAGKWYTRMIGVFFVLVVFSLIADFAKFGLRPETMHKLFHVLLGIAVIRLGWNSAAWWRVFPLVNGAFFAYIALFGLLFTNFGDLDTFNFTDTMLHTFVGIFGVLTGLLALKNSEPSTQHEL